MNSFLKSTHCKNWIKTEEELKKIEKTKVEKILVRINEINKAIEIENEEKSRSNSFDKEHFQQYVKLKKYFDLEKEKLFIINYSNKLIRILNPLKQSTSLKATTVSYFRRFYLKKSILDYNPEYLIVAAFFLGAKVAQIDLPLEKIELLFTYIKGNYKKLFDYEFFLSTILDYNFYVYNPYHALYGLIYILEQKKFFLGQNTENYINQEQFKQECMDIIDKMLLTDNIFLYTHSEIALTSIFMKLKEKNLNIINIAEKMELDKVINVKEFLEGPFEKMKKNLDSLPKYESVEEEEKACGDIYKMASSFLKKYPVYQKKLEEERAVLKQKMKDFSNDFDVLLRAKGLDGNKKEK